MKINKFVEMGSDIVLGLVGTIVLKEIAHSYSLIENTNSLQSLPALAVGIVGYTMGYMVSQFLIKKLKNKHTDDSNENFITNESNVKSFKDWHWVQETKSLNDVFKDDTFEGTIDKSSPNVIPVAFKKSKII